MSASVREQFITLAHYGNGTGCRCCSLVDDGYLDALLAIEDAARWVQEIWVKTATVNRTAEELALDDALAKFDGISR